MTKDHIKEYWESQASIHGDSHWASWGDNWMIDLEINTISKYIKNGDRVLDIGCANGYSTFKQAELHKLSSIDGVDFSKNMIAHAKKQKKNLSCNINFNEGDIRKLEFQDNTFDIVYTTRVLINLPTWEQQMKAISECIRVVKPNGIVILSEGFWEPLMLLNAMRSLKNLPPLVEHDFNRYLKLSILEKHLESLNVSYEIEDFSSIYYLGSRFLRDLVTDPSLYPGFSNPINKIFYEIEKDFSGGGMGIQQAVIINKIES
jgi:SAM-dependent methyltransferase